MTKSKWVDAAKIRFRYRYTWPDALAFAQEGVAKPLIDLITDGVPAAHRTAVAAIVTAGIPKHTGRPRRLSPTMAGLARTLYQFHIAPKADRGDGWSPLKARGAMAKFFGVDESVIREIVDMTGAYAADRRKSAIVGKRPL